MVSLFFDDFYLFYFSYLVELKPNISLELLNTSSILNSPDNSISNKDTLPGQPESSITIGNRRSIDSIREKRNNSTSTGGGKIIGPPLVNAKKLTFYFKKRSVRLVNIFDRNIGICDILVCLYSLFSSFKCM